ncbi:MAG: RecBCD enzyme subunit RecD [Syntrophus sp. SKADARSKE-3]|nr:RecBCD enzyme subunit RecD [Syntrophus sp. SKADARSKE-3]
MSRLDINERPFLSELDIRFGRFLEELSEGEAPAVFLAAALTSHFRSMGHICLDLDTVAGKTFPLSTETSLSCPSLATWHSLLETSPVIGKPGDDRPLILDRNRLYLYRYWAYEDRLARLLKDRATKQMSPIDGDLLRDGLCRFFGAAGNHGPNWAKAGAITAICRALCIITGGPGTGKTTTVAKILALLLEQRRGAPLRIALCAPTGKAAARILQSMTKVRASLDCDASIKAAMPDQASTIHRLLGSIPHSPYFRYHEGNPLPVDVVVVDEASMVDLALFSKFLQAVPPSARLIVLGDKDQLSSVEAGAVLGDICDTGHEHGHSRSFAENHEKMTGEVMTAADSVEGGLADAIVTLQENFRFREGSGIGALSRAVNDGQSNLAISLMKENMYNDIAWYPLPRPDDWSSALEDWIVHGYRSCLETTDPSEAFHRFSKFRILCALREGPYGINAINALVEQILRKRRLIRRDSPWYAGRPVMVVRNDYTLRLFNGDIGIALACPHSNSQLRVFFAGDDNTFRSYPPLRLPEHETVFAMTIHKSQGSEFDECLMILPDRDTPVLTRELVYTGITRARVKVRIWGTEAVFQLAVSRRTERMSGLRDALWKNHSG